LILSVCFCSLAFLEQKQTHFAISGQAQGTTYSISYYHETEKITKRQVDSILSVIDTSMSLYNPHSLISEINQSPIGGFLDPHFLKVMQKSIQVNKETDGLFDVTVAPLVSVWGFSTEKIKELPDSNLISNILPMVGMQNIRLKGNYLEKLKAGVKIDLNGIAPGYTVEVLADYFISKGVKNFIIEVGGELRAEGKKPNGESFSVGIEGPINATDTQVKIKHIALINGKALATSGSYRHYLQYGKERLTHIINPKTGYPIQSEILSATVLSDDATLADGYASALMVMGVDDAFQFLNKQPDLEAYFVYKDRQDNVVDTMSNGFKAFLKN